MNETQKEDQLILRNVNLPRGVKDLTGCVFGSLTVVRFSHVEKTQAIWECQCECGSLKKIRGRAMHDGGTISCGCKRNSPRSHGETSKGRSSIEYGVMARMIDRCLNPNNKDYKDYGGRGITVCDQWNHLSKFTNFLNHIGRRPIGKHTIDRIDNSKGYEPGNVRWATWTEQQRNKRVNKIVTHNGVSLCLSEWSEKTGINYDVLRKRLDLGWNASRALTEGVVSSVDRNRSEIGAFKGVES